MGGRAAVLTCVQLWEGCTKLLGRGNYRPGKDNSAIPKIAPYLAWREMERSYSGRVFSGRRLTILKQGAGGGRRGLDNWGE